MTDKEAQIIYGNYLDAFTRTSPSEQEELLRASVVEDLVYTSPGVEGRGRSSLLAHIAVFQARFPGGSFRMNWLRQQHGHLLAEWTQLDHNGSELVTGHSYARLSEDGRLAQLAGLLGDGSRIALKSVEARFRKVLTSFGPAFVDRMATAQYFH